MSLASNTAMLWADWLDLLQHMLMFSAVSVGGPLAMVSEMHRYIVTEQHWLTDIQFNASVVIAQAAPGPNVLFVALLGWNIGMNVGGYGTAFFALLVSMIGILLPSSTMIFITSRWVYRNRDRRLVRAFKQGMSPVVISMLIASGWILATANTEAKHDWPLWLVTIITTLLVLRTKLHMFLLLAAGAVLGSLGLLYIPS
jgi:chromate transporter